MSIEYVFVISNLSDPEMDYFKSGKSNTVKYLVLKIEKLRDAVGGVGRYGRIRHRFYRL